jgi:hypothetical protein
MDGHLPSNQDDVFHRRMTSDNHNIGHNSQHTSEHLVTKIYYFVSLRCSFATNTARLMLGKKKKKIQWQTKYSEE